MTMNEKIKLLNEDSKISLIFLQRIEKTREARYNKLSDLYNFVKAMQTEENCMIKNNIEVDVKVKCIESGMTQAQLAEKIKTTSPYVNRIIKKQDGGCGCGCGCN